MDCLKPTFWSAGIFLFFFSLFSAVLQAAERLPLRHLSDNHLQKLILFMLSAKSTPTATVRTQDFLLIEQHRDQQRTEHTRLQQRYMGFPVMGGYAILHQRHEKGKPSPIGLNGTIYQKLQQDLGDCPIDFVAKADQVLQSYSHNFPQDLILEKTVQPLIYIDKKNKAHWAYQVQVYWQPHDALPSQMTAIVAIEEPEKVLLEWDALTTLKQRVLGSGFGGNLRTGKYQYGKDFPYLSLLRDEQNRRCFLENNDVMIVDMQHHTRRLTAPMSFECGDDHSDHIYWTGYAGDGYDRTNGGYSVSNDAMYFAELIKKMYRSEYGVEILPMHPMICRVHFSQYFANAFWDGRQMTFGDGDGSLHPLVGLSITAHELSHGFTQYHSGLVYQGQAGAINESFSDMAAQAAEYYVYGKPTWKIGADVLKGQGALRFFQYPSHDGVSIDRAQDYRPGMDVHYSSGVYNRLFYSLATHEGWDPKKAFQAMLKANMDYWTPTTTFVEGACGLLSASNDLGFSTDDVKDALDEVMIDYGDCEI